MALLTPQSQATVAVLGQPQQEGIKGTEIAEALGVTPSWVSERMASLRREMKAQIGILRELTPAEFSSLRDSIDRLGIQNPLTIATVNGRTELIDGRHRFFIAGELDKLHEVPWIHAGDLTTDQARELTFTLNLARRQYSADHQRELVDAELQRDHETGVDRSDRWIASTCGVSHPFVASRRRHLDLERRVLAAHPEPPEHDPLEAVTSTPPAPRLGRDGRTQRARTPTEKPARVVEAPATRVAPIPVLTSPALPCPGCGNPLHATYDKGHWALTTA
jgi:transcriptional regulator with XRE-family HTH domain